MAFDAGEVFVRLSGLFVRDEFDKWDRAVDQERAKANTPVNVKLGADQTNLNRDLREARGKLDSWSHTDTEAPLKADVPMLVRSLESARATLSAWATSNRQVIHVDVDVDTTGAEAKIAMLKAEVDALSDRGPGVGNFTAIRTGAAPLTSGALSGLVGSRGTDNVGSPNNPIVTTLEAGSIAGLASRAAQIGYATQAAQERAGIAPGQSTADYTSASDRLIQSIISRLRSTPDTQTGRPVAGLLPVSSQTHGEWTFGSSGPTAQRDEFVSQWIRSMRGEQAPDPGAWARSMGNAYRAQQDAAARDAARAMRAAMGGGGGNSGGGGGGGGGGGADDGGGGNWLTNFLFNRGPSRGGRWLGPLFAAGIHGPFGMVGGALGLGPEHIVSAVGSVLGSGVGALGGAGVVAAGALGQMAVGGGSDAAVLKSTITDTRQLYQGYSALNTAVVRYGAGSTQAAQAQSNLNTQMIVLGNTAGVKAEAGLAKAASALNDYWDKATSSARVSAVHILSQVVNLGHDYVPKVAEAARQNLNIINDHIKPLFTWLEGPGMAIFDHLEARFKANLPTAVDAFVNVVEALLKTVNQASDFTGRFTQKLDDLAKRWNNMDPGVLHDKLSKLVNDLRIWEDMIKNLAIDLYRLFHAGAGEGNDLVVMFDHLLQRWGAWEKSAQGSMFLKTFFKERKDELVAILGALGSVLSMFGAFYRALQPLVPVVTLFAREIATALKDLASFINPLFSVFSDVLKFLVDIGGHSTVIRDDLLAPLGIFLITWNKFGLDAAKNLFNLQGHFSKLKEIVGGLSGVVKTLFAEGPSAAWANLKTLFSGTTPDSPQMTMLEAMKEGGVQAAASIREAFATASAKLSGSIETAMAGGGKVAAEEIGVAERAGASGIILPPGVGRGAAGAAATSGEMQVVEGAAGGGLLARVGGGLASRLVPAIAAAVLIQAGLQSGSREYSQSSDLSRFARPSDQWVGAVNHWTAQAGTHFSHNVGDMLSGLNPFGSHFMQIKQIDDTNHGLDQLAKNLNGIKDPAKLSADQVNHLYNEVVAVSRERDLTQNQRRGLQQLYDLLKPIQERVKSWDDAFNKAWEAVNHFAMGSGDTIKNLKDRFDTNMRLIASTVGLNSDAGQKLATDNFNKLVTHVEQAMARGKVSVHDGINFMRSVADKGTDGMKSDLTTRYADIVTTIQNAWEKGRVNTKDANDAIRSLTATANSQIRDDIKKHYDDLLGDAKQSWHNGLLTDSQYAAQRVSLHKQMAHDIAQSQVTLTTSTKGILQGMVDIAASATDSLFSQLNNALGALNVARIHWKSGATTIISGGTNLGTLVPYSSSNTTRGGGAAHGGLYAGGGMLPSMFGHQDNLTLMDPLGRPVARMAGDEAIFNRHQMPYVEAGLHMLGFNGADDLWNKISTPHYLAQGGRVTRSVNNIRKFAQGGYTGYSTPLPKGAMNPGSWSYDQGVDIVASAGTPEYAIGPGVIVQEGIPGFGPWAPILRITAGPLAGQEFYYGHAGPNFAHKGQTVRAGQEITQVGAGRVGISSGPHIEFGFWPPRGGAAVAPLLRALMSGAGVTGRNVPGGTLAGGMGAIWNNLVAPHITGAAGPLANLAQGAVNHVADAMNQYGQKIAGTVGGVGGSFVNLPGTVTQWLQQAMNLAGVSGPVWLNVLKRQTSRESGGNPRAVNNWDVNAQHGDPSEGLLQTTLSTFAQYHLPGHGNIFNPIDNAAAAIRYMIAAYGGGNAARAAATMWARGGGAYATGGRLGRGLGRLGAAIGRNGLPGFAGGGRLANVPTFARGRGLSLYRPTRPKKRPRPKQMRVPRSPALVRYLSTVPGLQQFSDDDAKVTKLEDQYSRQENIFNLYDPNGLTPTDLDVLAGIRENEWSILYGEYTALPNYLSHLRTSLLGTPHTTGHGKNRRTTWTGGINQQIGHLTGMVNADEDLITHLNDQLYRDQQNAAISRHNITKASLDSAQAQVMELVPLYDQILTNLQTAGKYTDQIANLPTPVVLGYLMGNAYARGQQQNLLTTQQRRQLNAARTKVLEKNSALRAKIGIVMQRRQQLALRYRQEGFDAAWQYQIERYAVGWRIRKLKEELTKLKAKLKKEQGLAKQYEGAISNIDGRLNGPDTQNPDTTGITGQLGDVGFDILSLQQQGADVPNSLTKQITEVLNKLGVQLPEGAPATGYVSAAAALQDFMNFQQNRANMFASFGSNFVGAGQNPFGSPTQVAAGMQYFGAAAGASSGVPGHASGGYISPPPAPGYSPSHQRSGDTIFNIEQHFGGAPDPHTYSAGLRHELGALV